MHNFGMCDMFHQYVDASFNFLENDTTHFFCCLDKIRPITSLKLYKNLGLVEVNKDLFKVLCYVSTVGIKKSFDLKLHYKNQMFYKMQALYRSNRVDIFYIGNSLGTVYMCRYMPIYKTCNQCLRMVETQVKDWLRRKKILVFLMGAHARLGQESSVKYLTDDILMTVNKCFY